MTLHKWLVITIYNGGMDLFRRVMETPGILNMNRINVSKQGRQSCGSLEFPCEPCIYTYIYIYVYMYICIYMKNHPTWSVLCLVFGVLLM